MRDDLSRLPLPQSAKKYARISGLRWAGPAKPRLYAKMVADITNGGDTRLKIKDAGELIKMESADAFIPTPEDRCAWCLKERGERSPDGTSHGVCRRHYLELMAELDSLAPRVVERLLA